MQFFNEMWRRWVPSEWLSKNLSSFPSWYAENNLVNNESALLQPLTKDMLGCYFTILVCGQRILATVNMFAAIHIGGVWCDRNSNTICVIRLSHCNPSTHFLFFYNTRIDKLCKSMSRRSWITYLVSKEVQIMKEDFQLPNSPLVILLPQQSHALDQKIYSLAFPLCFLALSSYQHQH